MALQTQNLVLVGLGLERDAPPNAMQPPLVRGIHLRWAFAPKFGFPWYGYYLFRRSSGPGEPVCLELAGRNLHPGRLPGPMLSLPSGQFESDTSLVLTDEFPFPRGDGNVEFSLEGRTYLRFQLPDNSPARWAEARIGFRADGEVRVVGYSLRVPFVEVVVKGRRGEIVPAVLEFSLITAVEFGPGPASLVNVCIVPVSQGAGTRWQSVPQFPEPMCLPVRHPHYPCNGGLPIDEAASEATALARVRYGPPNGWAGDPFKALHAQILALVQDGPGGQPMASKSVLVPGVADPPDPPGAATPVMPHQRPLDLVLLASLNPAVAQMIGLYWVDQKVNDGDAFDYLILADESGRANGDAAKVLQAIAGGNFNDFDTYILFNQKLAPPVPLPAPQGLKVYSLPGGTITLPGAEVRNASNNAGLRWDRGVTETGLLRPGQALMFHLWRAGLGDAAPAAAPPAGAYALITREGPVLVADTPLAPDQAPPAPPDWPPFPLFTQDNGLPDGWYSYQVSGVDIFGRYSPQSANGPWFQWTPPPDPRPWYYVDPPADARIHPFAIRLLDKVPPPPPTGTEAYALDPSDPTVRQNVAFMAWWNALTASAWYEALTADARRELIGLRVRWLWTYLHQRQAPDTREFRLYFNPGTRPPDPDSSAAINWQNRILAVAYDEHVDTTQLDQDGNPLRVYEVFLPLPAEARHDGLPLVVTRANPIAYAHIGVSAADDKRSTADAAKWARTPFGDRFGNEGRVGVPAKVVRVLRVQPPRPVPPPDSERVFATPADYHGQSFYTYRWRPVADLKTHVFRALDETVFSTDWTQRPRQPALDPNDPTAFPSPADEPRWDQQKRQQVANELNQLNGFEGDAAGTRLRLAYYRALSNDGLRVLAGLPGNDRAFTQRTIQPLDPVDGANANRVGPDNPANFIVDPNLRAYLDTLDGRASNRYFFRCAYVDGAHNRGPLGLSGPPVWLPDLIPLAKPQLLKVLGAQRSVTLQWSAHNEPSVQRYRVFRTDDRAEGRDVRLMGRPVADLPALPLVATGGVVDLGAGSDIVTAERVYAADGFDSSADPLAGQAAAQYLPAPVAPVGTRIRGVTAPDSTPVVVVYRDSHQGLQYTPWGNTQRAWTDQGLVGARTYYYRVIADRIGETGTGPMLIASDPSDLAAGRAVDLTTPDPPAVRVIEWVRMGDDGTVYPYADPVPAGQTRRPAVHLVWTSADPHLKCLVQFLTEPGGTFANASNWLPEGTYEYVHRNEYGFRGLQYRLKVVTRAGNMNTAFAPAVLDPLLN